MEDGSGRQTGPQALLDRGRVDDLRHRARRFLASDGISQARRFPAIDPRAPWLSRYARLSILHLLGPLLPYLLVRLLVGLVRLLPLRAAWALGAMLGRVGWWVLPGYRRLARHNLRIAFPEKPAAERNLIARDSFSRFGANLLCGVRTAFMRVDEFRARIEPASLEAWARAMREPNARGRGALALLSHLGCWEMWARISALVPGLRSGTIYQPLRDARLEAWVRRLRAAHGLELFDRKTGFHAPAAFVRAGNALGVLADQHAGDGGVWTPFFGRLASTSPLAALIARRAGVPLVPTAMVTAGPARWRVLTGAPLTPRPGESAAALTIRVNAALEEQIAASPADWFWVHNRWKTPKPRFLLAATKRGVEGPRKAERMEDGGWQEAGAQVARPATTAIPETAASASSPGSLPSSIFHPPSSRRFRLLVRSPNWLGDAVMAAPAVRAMAAGRPDAEVTILAPEKLADFWRAVPAAAGVIVIPGARRGALAVASLVRKAGPFDAAVLLPNSLRSAAEAWLAGVPRRVGFPGHSRSWLLNQVVSEPAVPPGPARPHHAARYLHLATSVGAPPASLRPEGRPLPASIFRPPSSTSSSLRLARCPGAAYGPTKRWPAERFAEAAKLFAAQASRPVRWVLVGTAADAPAGAVIEAALGAEACENLLGQTTLAQLIETLRGCDALLTNDTGTMHLAAFLGVPLAAVFGSTDPQATGPLAAPGRARVLRRQVECSPCFLKECPLDLRCLHAIAPADAAAALQRLLDR